MGPDGSVRHHWLQVRKTQLIEVNAVKLAPTVFKKNVEFSLVFMLNVW